jgi:RimJ/RimL family protein N-acetyltransferase
LIRRLGAEQWATLREVRLRALADSPEAFGSTYAREADFDEAKWRERLATGAWFVAGDPDTDSDTDAVVGVAAGFPAPEEPPRRHLLAMWVAPHARGSATATDLVGAVLEWARADGALEVTLGVFLGNERALALYAKCGFVRTGQRITLEGEPPREAEIWRRPLTA